MIQLTKGTVEHIPINIADRLGNLLALSGTNPTFDTKHTSNGASVETALAPTVVGLTAYCLIDTTQSIYSKDRYQLFLRFNALPEVPYLGPFDFEVI